MSQQGGSRASQQSPEGMRPVPRQLQPIDPRDFPERRLDTVAPSGNSVAERGRQVPSLGLAGGQHHPNAARGTPGGKGPAHKAAVEQQD